MMSHRILCLRRRFTIGIGSTVVLSMLIGSAPAQLLEEADRDQPVEDLHDKADLDGAVSGIVQLTNAFRKQHDLSELERDQRLADAAGSYAQLMARVGESGHTVGGTKPSQRASEAGYAYCIVLENVGFVVDSRGFEADRLQSKFVEGWKNSEGHRRNLLDADVTQIGVGIARREETGGYYAVQMFGRPQSEQIVFSVTNLAEDDVSYATARGESARDYTLQPRQRRVHHRCRPSQLSFPDQAEQPPLEVDSQTSYVINRATETSLSIDSEPLPQR